MHQVDPDLLPPDEEARLEAIRRFDILDTPPDGAFVRITALAARLFRVPIAIVSVVDTDRNWFKSHHGLDIDRIPRDAGLCAAIMQDGPCAAGSAVTVTARAGGQGVEVRIRDRGIGLPKEDRAAVFGLMVRTAAAARHAPGAGIGLYVCRRLVEAMGGAIWVEDAPGVGTVFAFRLPVLDA